MAIVQDAADHSRQERTHTVNRIFDYLRYAATLLAMFLTASPIYWIITTSIKKERDMFASPPAFLFSPTMSNYVKSFADPKFGRFMMNSIVISASVTLLVLVVGSLAAHT